MKFLIKKIVSKEGVLHFKRWRFIECKYFNVYLHGIYHHDVEAHMHDHPWDFISFVLKGSYVEKSIVDTLTLRSLFSFKYRKAEDVHKILYLRTPAVYTLVFTGPRRREWGYDTENGWIDNITYRKLKHGNKLDKTESK